MHLTGQFFSINSQALGVKLSIILVRIHETLNMILLKIFGSKARFKTVGLYSFFLEFIMTLQFTYHYLCNILHIIPFFLNLGMLELRRVDDW